MALRPNSPLHRSCPLCGQDNAEAAVRKDALQLVRCRGCTMVYANPVGGEFASGEFYDQRAESFYLSPDKLRSDYAAVRFVREQRLFRAHCLRGAVLDVGCSTGAFLRSLAASFPGDYELHGTDVAGAALDHAASQGVQVLPKPFLEFDGQRPRFDAITFWAVVEHLVEPKPFLAKAASLLKPGGFCFVLVPNLKSLAVRILGARYRYIMPEHVNYFTPSTLRVFGQSGPEFEVLELTSTHFNPVVILKDWKGKAAFVPDSERVELLKRTTAWKQNRWLRPARMLYTGAERILAAFHLADNLAIVLRKQS